MIHRMYSVVFVALMALPAGAQDRGVLAIDEEAGRHAFSFDSEADREATPRATETRVSPQTQEPCEYDGIKEAILTEDGKIAGWVDADGKEFGLSWCPADAPCAVLNPAVSASMYRCFLLDAVAKEEPDSPKAATEEQIREGTATYEQIYKRLTLNNIRRTCDEIDEKNRLGRDGRFGDELADGLKTKVRPVRVP